MPTDAENLDTGAQLTISEFIDQNPDYSTALRVIFGNDNASGLNLNSDAETTLLACMPTLPNALAAMQILYQADPSDYVKDGFADFLMTLTAKGLEKQEGLSLQVSAEMSTLTATQTIEQAFVTVLDNQTLVAYVSKDTAQIVLSETTLSTTAYIPIGEYAVTAGKLVSNFALYTALFDVVEASYNAATGHEADAFANSKDALVAGIAFAVAALFEAITAAIPIADVVLPVLMGGLTAVEMDKLTDELPVLIATDKANGKTESEILDHVREHIANVVNAQWAATGSTATTALSDAQGYIGSLFNGTKDLAAAGNWAPVAPLPDYCVAAKTPWNSAFSEGSPLVLDLTTTHTGIALTTFNASTTTTFFDIDNSGFATQTAWVGANMGLLCRDLNSNGTIDNAGELFGSPTVDGFALLSTLDSNGDHRIDQYDSAWSTLKIWVDANGDAVTQGGELHSMSDLGVASIDLAAVASSTSVISGNAISHTSFFTFTSGATAAIDDAWFVHDKTDSYYNGDYTLDVDTLFLPTLRGFGTLPDLVIAESQDSTLKGLVSDFASGFDPATSFADATTLNDDITDILYRWAGVDGVSSTSRGANIDARVLEFLEKFFGQNFVQNGIGPNPMAHAADDLTEAWQRLYYFMKAALLTEVGADIIYGGTISYNPSTGDFDGDKVLSQAEIDALQAAAPTTNTADRSEYWQQIAEYINFTKGFENLVTAENTMMNNAIVATDSSLSWTIVSNAALGLPDVTDQTITGTSGNDTLNGWLGNDTINGLGGADTIHGDAGNDTITVTGAGSVLYGDGGDDALHAGSGGNTLYGGSGNDTLTGGSGNDLLDPGSGGNFVYGKGGNDTYVFSGADDVYSEYSGSSGTDTILLPSGITLGSLTFTQTMELGDSIDLTITVGTIGEITIQHFFLSNGGSITAGGSNIETLTFADASTYTLTSMTSIVTQGTSGDDSIHGASVSGHTINNTVYAGDGDDLIYVGNGTNSIDGGAGNDIIHGGTGSDTYVMSAGFDRIIDSSTGTNILLMPDGVTAEDVHFLRHSNTSANLDVTVDGLGQVTIDAQFTTAVKIAQIEFHDSSTISLSGQVVETVGTTGNDTLTGITLGGSTNDILDGREGNDLLSGGAGNDTYIVSVGHDSVNDSGGTDKIFFGDNWLPTDITFYRGIYNELYLQDGAGNVTSITGEFQSTGAAVETIEFSNGTTWNPMTMAMEVHGTSGNDTISPSAYGNQALAVYGYDGADNLHAGTSDSQIYGGNGNDALYGQSGNDFFSGGDGSDTITGNSGADTIAFYSGETGSDTVYGFSTSQGDKIDLHDLLTGYDPLTSAITDFVHVTASGSNAIVSVDANGATGGASFTQIATLSGLSSLAGHEADMLANGNLIAHAA
ncbi:calcium-binding protein [Mesorhizobium sophorae]|uniref:calcium-binding protein n=1 Tax=Mesorhizobium sophorae TaxID=1300294 RepID=UPI000BA377B3|nr:calcium-binding protein [Mesorhizobium sophorae]